MDIYATSVDYDAKNEQTREFFKTVQNKMHYAVHGNIAAEVIFNKELYEFIIMKKYIRKFMRLNRKSPEEDRYLRHKKDKPTVHAVSKK